MTSEREREKGKPEKELRTQAPQLTLTTLYAAHYCPLTK